MSLKHSYTLLSPIYDWVVSTPTEKARKQSLQQIAKEMSGKHILINGIGSGLDIPFLNKDANYTGTDITPAMLNRAQRRAQQTGTKITLQQADVMALPYTDNSFDAIVMHLILAVVPQPLLALQEACRVLKPGGKIYILDKFIKPGDRATLLKLINTMLRHIATRTDVVFEELHECCDELLLVRDEPAMLGGWFRHIELQKRQ